MIKLSVLLVLLVLLAGCCNHRDYIVPIDDLRPQKKAITTTGEILKD